MRLPSVLPHGPFVRPLLTAICVCLTLHASSVGLNPASARSSRALSRSPDGASMGHSRRGTVEVLSQSDSEVVLRFSSRHTGSSDRHPGSSDRTPEDTGPHGLSALVRVADTGVVRASVTAFELTDSSGTRIHPPPGFDAGLLVELGEPAVMRDIRIVRVTFHQDGADRGLPGTVANSVTVTVRTEPGTGRNEKRHTHALRSPAFERLYEQFVVNYEPTRSRLATGSASGAADALARGGAALEGSRYVVVALDQVVDVIEPLVELKRDKGLLPRVIRISDVEWTAEGIKAYLEDAYYNWDVPPEFVLLAGDEYVPPGFTYGYTDHYFAMLEGDDYLADIIVGRLPADNVAELTNMVAKVIAYETAWLQDDPDWLTTGALLVGDDEDDGDTIYYDNTWFVHDLMTQAGFSPVDTLFKRNDATLEDVYASVNEGRGFINYRGCSGYFSWPPPFDIDLELLESGGKTPIVLSGTCYTGGYYGDYYMSELWLQAGTPEEPSGAVAFFGTATADQGQYISWLRTYVSKGFFAGAFGEACTVGEACLAGKTNLFVQSNDALEYHGWNLMGEPEMPVWTALPCSLTVALDSVIENGWATIEVDVESEGVPVDGADVVCWSAAGAHALAGTDSYGAASLVFEATAPSTVEVSVVAKNARPRRSTELLLTAGPFLCVDSRTVDDAAGGNGDGLVSPGESALVSVRLRNLGDERAEGIEALLRTPLEFATIADSLSSYESIEPGSEAGGETPFRVVMSEEWAGDHPVPLELVVTCGDSARTWSVPPLETVTGSLEVAALECCDVAPGGDGSGTAGAGESPELVLTLKNPTSDPLCSIEARLTSADQWVAVVTADASFPEIDAGAEVSNVSMPFGVCIAPDAPPHHAAVLRLLVSAEAPTYTYAETLDVAMEIVEAEATRPSGPDRYGYYAYDSTDVLYDCCPTYDWVDIAPPGPGILVPMATVQDDGARMVFPPFIINYYGEPHYYSSVSSNGLVSFVDSNSSPPWNRPIPYPLGPNSMTAPFWDDLDPSAGGDIYSWCDMEGRRFVIQFESVRRKHSLDTETFQVIVYDPEHHPTPTGDAPILFQYESVAAVDSCTVGIEGPEQHRGLQYVFDGSYAEHAAPICDGLAILFTTTPPETLELPWLGLTRIELDDSTGGNGDGVPCPGETLALVVEMANTGRGPAEGLELCLSSGDSCVAVLEGATSLVDLPPGGVATNEDDPFVLRVVATPPDSLVRLWLSFEGNAADHQQPLLYHLPIGAAPPTEIAKLALYPCRPNPFRGGTVISFDLPEQVEASVRVYDVSGRLVRTIHDGQGDAGRNTADWDGTNGVGQRVASGVYFVRLTAQDDSRTRKVVLLK